MGECVHRPSCCRLGRWCCYSNRKPPSVASTPQGYAGIASPHSEHMASMLFNWSDHESEVSIGPFRGTLITWEDSVWWWLWWLSLMVLRWKVLMVVPTESLIYRHSQTQLKLIGVTSSLLSCWMERASYREISWFGSGCVGWRGFLEANVGYIYTAIKNPTAPSLRAHSIELD